MSKYLKTKAGSLESAVLEAVSAAQQAAIAIAKKEKEEKAEQTECPKCEGKGCDHCDGKGYHEELSAKQKKIDANKNGKIDGDDLAKLRAKKEEVKEEVSLAQQAANYITDMWKESAYGSKKKVDKKEEMDDNGDESDGGKTMTGKPMSKVEVNPKDKEK